MNRPVIFFAILALIMLTLSSCTGIDILPGKEKTPEEVFTGLDGLAIEFIKNTPPELVFENTNFPVVLRVRNTGAFSIPEDLHAVVALGVEEDYNKIIRLDETSTRVGKLDPTSTLAEFYLEGRSLINKKGDEELISYTVQAKNLDPQSETKTSTLIATLCYPYKTKLTASICVDPDIINLKQDKSCTISELSYNQGQGAPVAVTKIETRIIPEEDTVRPQFVIHVENKGNGEVFKNDLVNEMCSNTLKSEEKNRIYNTIFLNAKLSGKELDCEPKLENSDQAYIKLEKKRDFVRCTAKDNDKISKNTNAYSAPLRIEMDYGYTTSVSTKYTIEKQYSR